MCAIFQPRQANDTIIIYPRFLYFLVQGNTFLPPLLKRYENAYVEMEKDGERWRKIVEFYRNFFDPDPSSRLPFRKVTRKVKVICNRNLS